jgi:hypothetical protein
VSFTRTNTVDSHLLVGPSANLYSLVMTCRANGIEPYAYLNYLFEHLPARPAPFEQIKGF